MNLLKPQRNKETNVRADLLRKILILKLQYISSSVIINSLKLEGAEGMWSVYVLQAWSLQKAATLYNKKNKYDIRCTIVIFDFRLFLNQKQTNVILSPPPTRPLPTSSAGCSVLTAPFLVTS